MQRAFKIILGLALFFQTALCAMDAEPVAESSQYHWAACQFRGSRTAQEDAFCYQQDPHRDPVFAVFDGHGCKGLGAQVSHYAAHTMPVFFDQARADGQDVPSALGHALAEIEKRSREPQSGEDWTQFNRDSGSTAVVVGIDAQHYAHIKNIGDSGCMFLDGKEDGVGCRYEIRCRTQDHTPHRRDEAERIFKAGGRIEYAHVKDNEYKIATCMRDLPQDFFGGQWTFYHSYAATPSIFPSALAMTRALGDKRMKAYGVSAEPESLEPQKIDENSLIVLMSDGVTDAYTDDDIVAKISHLMAATDIDYYRGFKEPDCLVGNNARLQHVVRVMGDFVLRQSRDSDNVTLMLIQKAKNQAGENHDEKNEK